MNAQTEASNSAGSTPVETDTTTTATINPNFPFAPVGEELEKLVTAYNEKQKLPTNFVTCAKSGTQVTMFGSNLTKRVAKFGEIRELLTTFICKKQLKADKDAAAAASSTPTAEKTETSTPVIHADVEATEIEDVIDAADILEGLEETTEGEEVREFDEAMA